MNRRKWEYSTKHDRQCTHNVTLTRVLGTIVAMEDQ